MATYIAQTLIDQGYTGATGSTPYKSATAGQISQLQNIYNHSFAWQVTGTASTNAIHININFDGTQNNGEILLPGDVSETNVWKLSDLQGQAGDPNNTIYKTGIGAQTVESGTLDANGNPAPGSSPSNWESTPWKAGEVGNAILEETYAQLTCRVESTPTDANTPNAKIALNLLLRPDEVISLRSFTDQGSKQEISNFTRPDQSSPSSITPVSGTPAGAV